MSGVSWFGWGLVVLFSASALLSVGTVGKARPVTTPGTAVIAVVLDALLILGILAVGTGSL